MSIVSRRYLVNRIALGLSLASAILGLAVLAAILWTLFSNGLQAITLDLFTKMTPPPGSDGGLANAIYGSFMMTLLATVVATPIGILAGTYLAEYGRGTKLGTVAIFVNDILLAAPSIVIGLFVYTLLVVPFRHFSGYAGAASLALIAIPVINRTTQDMLALVPDAMREAAAALGAPHWKIMTSVIWRSARSGMLTGVLLAVARISGETAPLLFTALNNQYWTADLSQPIANLPVVIFQFAMSPYEDWQRLAWGGALLITVTILVLNIVARSLSAGLLFGKKER
ncbi:MULTISPECIES: phosphate ABC transporter permease PstA [Rhizobium/Agrobacterium group]|uniref:phosphate ABC transporter permease PstA n=1 Tax=Rhizobium/Agrobacterium group TaxID=227290 RepID=UPI0012E8FE7C|nr:MULTISPECIES: phosphate ABC transporter permease PstA [Rhizobium/Agrobacterium group]MCF1471116.1 phosphate ABC transporter permease PstA [Allorhizobium ampelinum]MVA50685.1 phosphate ABC transporter permease PstA [Agrobacterium vitis]NSZ53347.1 phosphate ABC transporter permease PstA [Agrobacterium vitis]NTA32106.1 phosphate ABC transporter permease PstA [Agrobacterium vitis]